MTEDATTESPVAGDGVDQDAAVPGASRDELTFGSDQDAVAPPAAGLAGAERGRAPGRASDSGRRASRKVREGLVVSDRMRHTRVVAVVERVRHPRYAKTVQRTKRLYVHDEAEVAKVGDRVRVAECRPISKLKRWRLLEIVERAR
jgi:small subunit ribosomal protein S17